MVKQNWMEVRDVKAMAWTNSVHDTPMLCNEARGGYGVFFYRKSALKPPTSRLHTHGIFQKSEIVKKHM